MTAPPDRTGPGHLSSLLQPLAADAVAHLEVDAAAFYLLEGAAARWAEDAGLPSGETRERLRARSFESGVGPVGQVMATGQAWLASQEPAGRVPLPHPGEADLRPMAAVPLLGPERQVRGVLCLFGHGAPVLGERDLAFLRSLARAAALATENTRLTQRLAEQETAHRFLLDRLPDAIWSAGADRIFTYVSAGSEGMLGYRPEELIGRSSEILMHESSRQAFEDGYRWQIAHPDGDQTYRVNLRHRDGHPVPVELHNIGTPVNGRYGGGIGSVREISERLRLEREIQEQAAELAANRERAHLAQELHDSVTQALFGMTITAGAARMMLQHRRPGVEAKLDELRALAREALVEMRSLVFELRPGNLTEEGLLQSLRNHAAAVQDRTGLRIDLSLQDDIGELPLAVEEALYRIAQEAIHNVVKHARARNIRLRLGLVGEAIRMEIADDGVGFDRGARSDGLGLVGMATRAERLGGLVEVESSRDGGTRIAVRLPRMPEGVAVQQVV